ncbi:MAG: hypothetical protein II532_03520 [Bacteroidales bacterium]|nr:hypothetical protein [Bacteroidales bacterium]
MKKFLTVMCVIALSLWAIVVVSSILMKEGVRLAWHFDEWFLLAALLTTSVCAVLMAAQQSKGNRWWAKLMGWVLGIVVAAGCLVIMFGTIVFGDRRMWHNKDYVVYAEYGGFFEPDIYKLYRHTGFVDRRLCTLDNGGLVRQYVMGDDNWQRVWNVDYTIYEDKNLILCEADVNPGWIDEKDTLHMTFFHRLDNGARIDDAATDSLLTMVGRK